MGKMEIGMGKGVKKMWGSLSGLKGKKKAEQALPLFCTSPRLCFGGAFENNFPSICYPYEMCQGYATTSSESLCVSRDCVCVCISERAF